MCYNEYSFFFLSARIRPLGLFQFRATKQPGPSTSSLDDRFLAVLPVYVSIDEMEAWGHPRKPKLFESSWDDNQHSLQAIVRFLCSLHISFYSNQNSYFHVKIIFIQIRLHDRSVRIKIQTAVWQWESGSVLVHNIVLVW